MHEYSMPYRTLNCWECFQALGRMCIKPDYTSMMAVTGSSNFGHGLCCRNGYNEGFCSPSDSGHICSPQSYDPDPDSKYKDVRTNMKTIGWRNFEMFAFCPLVSHKRCGIDDSNSYDMNLVPTLEPKIVSSKEMRYKEGRPEEREYDACYY